MAQQLWRPVDTVSDIKYSVCCACNLRAVRNGECQLCGWKDENRDVSAGSGCPSWVDGCCTRADRSAQ